jgi:hypothetical protein
MLGAVERRRLEGERDLALAHTTALFMRAKVWRPLSHFLRRGRAPITEERGTMLDRLKAIALGNGGEVRE